ncbi:MAG: 3-hydroxyacyl-CoA dehydrogenase [Proteobacteria bacterium]|nr:3-hydroxyacyl-CoA dehydrogenase [Pseudomonadota bacterium]
MKPIQRVAVIGAGVMGAGIAAHIANAGVPVILMDIVPKGATSRNAIAAGAIEKLKKTNPAPLMSPKAAKLITPANTEDDMPLLAECDWIIEAVIERLDIKQSLYKTIAKHRKPGAVVSSNTSTLPLAQLLKGLPKDFRAHFLITHFFNPPRYMRLLEVVSSPETDPAALTAITTFADHALGKSVVPCFDTPGFIANRIGTYWMHSAVVHAIKQGVGVEEADAVLSKPMGVPKTGVFGLLDLVGLDLMPHILESMNTALPASDPFRKLGPAPALLSQMIKSGLTGRKNGGGFYKLDEKKNKLVMNLSTGSHMPAARPRVPAVLAAKKRGLKGLVMHDSAEGRYAHTVILGTLAYAASLVGEIAENIEHIDRAMRLGFGWKYGPFELIDKLGTAWVEAEFKTMGLPTPAILRAAAGRPLYRVEGGIKQFLTLTGSYQPIPRAPGVLLLEDIKRRAKPLFKNISASVWDLGDGIACLEFHSKMNALNPFIICMVNKAVRKLPALGFKGLVIYNEGRNFSVGANILMLLITSKLRLFFLINLILKHGQNAYLALKYAPFPVVAAPSGMALGGGAEILMHAHRIVASAESYIGLVEGGVGIIPGWGGCKELLARAAKYGKGRGPMPAVAHAFETIATAKVAKSAEEARSLHFLTPDDVVVMNPERLLATAKSYALSMAADFKSVQTPTFTLPGPSGFAALKMALHDFAQKGLATKHDVVVGTQLARTLTGAEHADPLVPLTEAQVLKLEREGLVALTKTAGTRARIAHLLRTGKPLRN